MSPSNAMKICGAMLARNSSTGWIWALSDHHQAQAQVPPLHMVPKKTVGDTETLWGLPSLKPYHYATYVLHSPHLRFSTSLHRSRIFSKIPLGLCTLPIFSLPNVLTSELWCIENYFYEIVLLSNSPTTSGALCI